MVRTHLCVILNFSHTEKNSRLWCDICCWVKKGSQLQSHLKTFFLKNSSQGRMFISNLVYGLTKKQAFKYGSQQTIRNI